MIDLRPLMISVSREAGIPESRATRTWVRPMGLINSSSRISPGEMKGNLFFLAIVVSGNR